MPAFSISAGRLWSCYCPRFCNTLFQGGVAAPLIKRSRSLAAQTGWFVISNKIRIATRTYTEATRLFTNHPRPLRGLSPFERRGMNSLQQLSSISKLLASANHQKSDVYANGTHSFRDGSDSSGCFRQDDSSNQLADANSYKNSTCPRTAPSMPRMFGFFDSIT